MKKSSLTKIIVSTILFVAFLTASLTLIIIAPKNEKVNLTYEIIDEYRADEYNYCATYKITNNSYATVEIDSIVFECIRNSSGVYYITSNGSPYFDIVIPSGESVVYNEEFDSFDELSNFTAKFNGVYLTNLDPTLYIGIGLLLPMLISGYFFIVFMVKGIKEKNQLKNEK